MKEGYENSELYRMGEMYKSIGEWIMNPKTTLRSLQQVADEYGVKLQVSIVAGDAPQEQSE